MKFRFENISKIRDTAFILKNFDFFLDRKKIEKKSHGF